MIIQRRIQNQVKHLRWGFKVVNYFYKNFHLRCLTRFWIHLRNLFRKQCHNTWGGLNKISSSSKKKLWTTLKLIWATTCSKLMSKIMLNWIQWICVNLFCKSTQNPDYILSTYFMLGWIGQQLYNIYEQSPWQRKLLLEYFKLYFLQEKM